MSSTNCSYQMTSIWQCTTVLFTRVRMCGIEAGRVCWHWEYACYPSKWLDRALNKIERKSVRLIWDQWLDIAWFGSIWLANLSSHSHISSEVEPRWLDWWHSPMLYLTGSHSTDFWLGLNRNTNKMVRTLLWDQGCWASAKRGWLFDRLSRMHPSAWTRRRFGE